MSESVQRLPLHSASSSTKLLDLSDSAGRCAITANVQGDADAQWALALQLQQRSGLSGGLKV